MNTTLRIYAGITALIGATQVLFNAWWLGESAAPLDIPQWVATFEVTWGFVSFAVLLWRRKIARVTAIAGSYVIYTGFALVYTMYLGTRHGSVTEEMVPEWWKILAVIIGLWFVIGSSRLAMIQESTEASQVG